MKIYMSKTEKNRIYFAVIFLIFSFRKTHVWPGVKTQSNIKENKDNLDSSLPTVKGIEQVRKNRSHIISLATK